MLCLAVDLRATMPKGKKFNADDRRQRRSADLRLFVTATGRKAHRGNDPNDRAIARETTIAVRHMCPSEFDNLLRDGDDD